MKRTKTRKALVIMIFLLPLFSMGQQGGKISKVKIYAPADAYNRANVTGLLDIDHFYTDDDGGIVSEINETMLARLKNMPYKYEILVPDVMKELDSLNQIYYRATPQQRVAIEQQGSTSGAMIITPAAFQVKGTFGGYYSFAEMEAAMDALVASYPTIASKTSIGTTVNGNNIWVIKISDNVGADDPNEPEVLYMGLQHCREAIGGS